MIGEAPWNVTKYFAPSSKENLFKVKRMQKKLELNKSKRIPEELL